MDERIGAILAYWFEGLDEKSKDVPIAELSSRWFKKSDETDQYIIDHFSSDLTKARKGKCDTWLETPEGTLALVILLDQFSRNVYRNSAKAFDTDLQVLEFSLRAIQKEQDQKLNLLKRQFIYLPLMHSENLKIQEKCIELYEEVLEEAQAEDYCVEYFKGTLDYAKKHHVIIERFQRFPHRNEVLGRRSTPSEIEFLQEPGSSF